MLEVRIIIALLMLSIGTYFDLKKRVVHDLLWIISGSIGALLYINDLDLYNHQYLMISIISSVAISSLAWYIRLFGGADALAIISLSLILPVYKDMPLPLFIIILSGILSLIYIILYNIIINTYRYIKEGSIFNEFDELKYRKILAFILIHKMVKFDKFVYIAEESIDGKRRFRFSKRINDTINEYKDIYVSLSIPFLLYMLLALIIIIIWQN